MQKDGDMDKVGTAPPSMARARRSWRTSRMTLVAGAALAASTLPAPAAHALTRPPARVSAAMAYDGSTGEVVVFGGGQDGASRATDGFNQSLLNDTWTWNGSDWMQRTVASPPVARRGAVMAYDKVAKRVVLFGGEPLTNLASNTSPALNDTWTWNGTASTWTQELTGSTPPPRKWASMAFDAATQTVVMFGGFTQGSIIAGGVSATPTLDDTWVWDGTTRTWSLVTPPVSPPRRGAATMAYDAVSRKVVLQGGATGPTNADCTPDRPVPCELGNHLDDTWTWNGVTRTWTRESPTSHPPAFADAAMAYDPARRQIVMYGGALVSRERTTETWVWSGTTRNWKKKSPVKNPGMNVEGSMAYHVGSQRMVLFGGYDNPFSVASDKTWTWDGVNWMKAI